MASCAHFDVLELFSWKTHFRFSFGTFLGGSGIAIGARARIWATKSDLKTPLVGIPWVIARYTRQEATAIYKPGGRWRDYAQIRRGSGLFPGLPRPPSEFPLVWHVFSKTGSKP